LHPEILKFTAPFDLANSANQDRLDLNYRPLFEPEKQLSNDKRIDMLKLLAKIFGDKSQKDIKLMMPLVEQTKREGESLISITNDELRNKTKEVQLYINDKLKPIDDQIAALHTQIADQPEMDLNE
jgi:hypothetical protein